MSRSSHHHAGLAAATVAAGATLAVCAPSANAAYLPPSADFNGDGHSDLAIGAPDDSVDGQGTAGALNVIYGAGSGLESGGNQEFTEASGLELPEAGDHFGTATATGDFDGDGYGDLAVGAPGEDLLPGSGTSGQQAADAGAVFVLYGSRDGLRTAGHQFLTQDVAGIEGRIEAGDGFGSALAAGDFDGDGRDDLAIGVPNDSVSGRSGAGAVNVLYGTRRGLRPEGRSLWTLDTPGVQGLAGANFRFGAALAAGDLSRNGRDELAVGIPGGRISGAPFAGAALVLYGRSSGLSDVDDLWSQDARGIKGRAERSDNFGSALAIGDFDRDGAGDLAIAAPNEEVGGAEQAGAVNVLYGTGGGLTERRDQLWTRNTRGVKAKAQAFDRFGTSLAAGDLSRDAAGDLAIGVPGDRVGGHISAGSVTVLYGGRGDGLTEDGDERWSQDSRGVKAHAGTADFFGRTLAVGDFDADDAFDLVVGVPGEDVGSSATAGAVNVLPGGSGGLTERGDQFWSQGSGGILGAVGADSFGASLASGSR